MQMLFFKNDKINKKNKIKQILQQKITFYYKHHFLQAFIYHNRNIQSKNLYPYFLNT